MLRSLLFIPGNQPNMLQNAYLFDADAIIFDLEDSVHVFEKDNARNLVKEFLNVNKPPKHVENYIRINGLDTPFFESDLEALITDSIDGIVLPKATIDTIQKLDMLLTVLEKSKRIHKSIKVIPIIESAYSVLQVDMIASMQRVSGLLLGAEDLTRDLAIKRTLQGDEIYYAREKVIMAASAFQIDAIDTPFTDVYNDEAMKQDVLRAAALGMKAKSAIHPRHIEFINQTFSPSEKDIVDAFKIIRAKNQADIDGKGAFSVDGKMVDKPIIERALNTIEKAKAFHLLKGQREE